MKQQNESFRSLHLKLKRNQDCPSKSETLVYLREKAEKDQELKLNEMLFMT